MQCTLCARPVYENHTPEPYLDDLAFCRSTRVQSRLSKALTIRTPASNPIPSMLEPNHELSLCYRCRQSFRRNCNWCGGVGATGFVVKEDDKGVQSVYQPAPIVRADVLAEYPAIAEILNLIFAGLDMATLQKLNGRIQVGGEPAEAVARDFLTQTGVLK